MFSRCTTWPKRHATWANAALVTSCKRAGGRPAASCSELGKEMYLFTYLLLFLWNTFRAHTVTWNCNEKAWRRLAYSAVTRRENASAPFNEHEGTLKRTPQERRSSFLWRSELLYSWRSLLSRECEHTSLVLFKDWSLQTQSTGKHICCNDNVMHSTLLIFIRRVGALIFLNVYLVIY